MRLKNAEAAIADYNAALDLSHMCSRCFYGRGLALLEQGNSSAMMEDVAQAKRLNPTIEQEFWNPFGRD